jgi:hypothetical protein
VVPVDVATTAALVAEIKRLIGVVGGMALNQKRTWVGLTDAEKEHLWERGGNTFLIEKVEALLKEKNT